MFGFLRKKTLQSHNGPAVVGQSGFGAPLHIVFEERPLPNEGSAMSAAYLTYQLPRYTPIGVGVANKRGWLYSPSAPVFIQQQGIGVMQIGAPGVEAGSMAYQPLTDPTQPAYPDGALPQNDFVL